MKVLVKMILILSLSQFCFGDVFSKLAEMKLQVPKEISQKRLVEDRSVILCPKDIQTTNDCGVAIANGVMNRETFFKKRELVGELDTHQLIKNRPVKSVEWSDKNFELLKNIKEKKIERLKSIGLDVSDGESVKILEDSLDWIALDPNLTEITENTLWSSTETYYLNHELRVKNNAQLIIPSNTLVVIGLEGHLVVEFDGHLVCGYPEGLTEPLEVGSPSDNPIPPTWFIAESGGFFSQYYAGISFEGVVNESKPVRLNNVYIEGGYIGIIADNVDFTLTNSFIFGCYHGVKSLGPKDTFIINNQILYSGSFRDEIFSEYGHGIIHLMVNPSDPNVVDPNSYFYSENNTIHDQDIAIEVDAGGLYCEDVAPTFISKNDIFTTSYACALVCSNGYMIIGVYHPGFGGNNLNYNFEFNMINPVYVIDYPYQSVLDGYRYVFLDPCGLFVNAGMGMASEFLPGWTTSLSGEPDNGTVDLGVHFNVSYASRNDIECRITDINGDEITDSCDLLEFSNCWLFITDPNAYGDPNDFDPCSSCLKSDFNDDGIINLEDFARISNDWLKEGIETGLILEVTLFDFWSGQELDPNNVQGVIEINLNEIPEGVNEIVVYLDNKMIGRIDRSIEKENRIILDSSIFNNGRHSIKIVAIDGNKTQLVSELFNLFFNNLVYRVLVNEHFNQGEDYWFSAFNAGTEALKVEVIEGESVVWSQICSEEFVNFVIPASVFSGKFCYEISIEEDVGELVKSEELVKLSSDSISFKKWRKKIYKKFKISDYPVNHSARMVILLPNPKICKVRWLAIKECIDSCDKKMIPYVVLYYHDVNWPNLTHVLRDMFHTKYVYYCGHSNSHVDDNPDDDNRGVPRTHFSCWKIEKGWLFDGWEKSAVFSFVRSDVPDPNNSPELPNNWDNKGYSLWPLGLSNSDKFEFVFIDGCFSAEFSDMAFAFGMGSQHNQNYQDQCYLGWRTEVLAAGGYGGLIVRSTEFVRLIFENLGYGQTLGVAIAGAVSSGGVSMWEIAWGEDREMFTNDDNLWWWPRSANIIHNIQLQ